MSVTLLVTPANEKAMCRPCQLSENGLALIRTFEGYSPFVYKDSAGLDTIGYGHLIVKGEKFDQPLLPEAANKLLAKDAMFAVNGVNKYTKVKLKQNQMDSLVSFTFNLGVGTYSRSSIVKKVNANLHKEVPDRIMLYNKAGGKVIQGLVNRRKAEAALYIK
jgi:lysozyme